MLQANTTKNENVVRYSVERCAGIALLFAAPVLPHGKDYPPGLICYDVIKLKAV